MMNFKALSLTSLLVAATSILTVAAADGRHVVTHYETDKWCQEIDWDRQCAFAVPPGGSVLLSSCTNGDKAGRNKNTQATVFCSFTNLDIPGSETWVTGFVVTMAGAVPLGGGAPKDTSDCIN